jgi:hypothetical protein
MRPEAKIYCAKMLEKCPTDCILASGAVATIDQMIDTGELSPSESVLVFVSAKDCDPALIKQTGICALEDQPGATLLN